MEEVLYVSGKALPHITPHLEVWGSVIALYLFFGGLAAGLLFFANFFYLKGKADSMPMSVKVAPIIAPIIIILGSMILVYDLHHWMYFWQLFLHVRMESPMSWGAWTLSAIMIPAILWSLSYLEDTIEYLQNRNPKCKLIGLFIWANNLIKKLPVLPWIMVLFNKNKKLIAYLTIYLSIVLGVYTGILLSAFNARPLWNSAILGPLFLTSGVSTAAALIMWLSNDHSERKMYSKIDLFLIAVELFFIIHLFMGMLSGGVAQVEAAQLFLGGPYTAMFWVLIVGMGLVVPAILEIMELSGFHIPIGIPAFLILMGGLLFRFIMVYAGQASGFNIL
ncbi:MAG: nitrite reductase [Bacteroidetes bacterium]|nr:MAG: nitrite reductase [Bacteroidota bacterium]